MFGGVTETKYGNLELVSEKLDWNTVCRMISIYMVEGERSFYVFLSLVEVWS